MDLKFVAALLISLQICSTLTDAACSCTREYEPLCGSNGVTYNNPCLYRCAATTSGKKIKVVKYGPCDEPSQSCVCPEVLSPVCATDDKTYNNLCVMNCEAAKTKKSLTVKNPGKCKFSQKPDNCICTFIYSPVCGNDGKTYGNICTLNCAVRTNPKLKLLRNGPCK